MSTSVEKRTEEPEGTDLTEVLADAALPSEVNGAVGRLSIAGTEATDPVSASEITETTKLPVAPVVPKVDPLPPPWPKTPREAVYVPTIDTSIRDALIAVNPLKRLRGAALAIEYLIENRPRRNPALGDNNTARRNREPEELTFKVPAIDRDTGKPHRTRKRERTILSWRPDPETGFTTKDADLAWVKGGLSEIATKKGSHRNLCDEFAIQNPHLHTVSEPTQHMSHKERATNADLVHRQVERLAAESMYLLRNVAGKRGGNEGRKTDIYAVSLGTFLGAHMIALNLAEANPVNIETAYFISSAVVAQSVAESEDFRDPNIDEDEFREELASRFKAHVVKDLADMVLNNPKDIIASRGNVGAILFEPEILFNRLRLMKKDFEFVKQGFDWETLKFILENDVKIRVLGGTEDPLIQAQAPQWNKLNDIFARGEEEPDAVIQRLVPGYGHLLSADVLTTMRHLERLKKQTKQSQSPIVIPASGVILK